jgi:hypothetical protein
MSVAVACVASLVPGLVAGPAAGAATDDHSIGTIVVTDTSASRFTQRSLFDVRHVSPGDRMTRSFDVLNDSDRDVSLEVRIIDVALESGGVEGDRFFDDLMVTWPGGGSTARALADAQAVTVATADVGRGEVVPVTVGYVFPEEATSGNVASAGRQSLSFGLEVSLRAEAGGAGTDGGGRPAHGGTVQGVLATTGAPRIALVLMAAFACVGVGTWVWASARRRRSEREPAQASVVGCDESL